MDKDHKQVPPRWIDRFLEWFLPEYLLEDVQGDLQEVFYKQLQQEGLAKAQKEYLLAAIHEATLPKPVPLAAAVEERFITMAIP